MQLRSLFVKFSIVATLALVSTISYAKGTDLSGGGSSYVVNGQHVLLDFVVNQPASELNESPGGPVTTLKSKAPDRIGLDRISKNDFNAKFQNLLQPWEENSPMMVFLLKNAWEHIDIYFVKNRIQKAPFSGFIPNDFKSVIDPRKIQTVAVYDSRLGVLLSKPAFEEMGQDSQIGLLVHEVLRHMQKLYGFEFTDESLQLLTNAIVKHNPTKSLSLDSHPLLLGPVSDYTPEQLLTEMNRSFIDFCRQIQSGKILSNLEKEQTQVQCSEGLASFDKINNLTPEFLESISANTTKAMADRNDLASKLSKYAYSRWKIGRSWSDAVSEKLKLAVAGKSPQEAAVILSSMLDYDVIPENVVPTLSVEKKSEFIETLKPFDRAIYFQLVLMLKYFPRNMTKELRSAPYESLFTADKYMIGFRKQVIWYAIASANLDFFLDKSGNMVSDAIENLKKAGILVNP